MIPFNVIWLQVQAYSRAIIAGILLTVVAGTAIEIKVIKGQRDKARQDAAKLQVIVDAYTVASVALQARLDAAKAALDAEDAENAKLLSDLQKAFPKNPAEATAWAIESAKSISREAR